MFLTTTALAALLLGATPTEAAVLAEAFEAPAGRPAPVRLAWCPTCGGPMLDRPVVDGATARVSVCRSHGVWIDAAHVPGALRVLLAWAVGRAGDLERAAFADDLRRRRYAAILAHARALGDRHGARVPRSPLGLLASLFA